MLSTKKMRIKKDDIVQITAGKELGKKGKVLKVFPSEDKVMVEKLNMIKRHTKPSQKMREGGIVEKEAKLDLSNVMLVCSRCDATTRVERKVLENGKKVRVCKKCKEVIDQ